MSDQANTQVVQGLYDSFNAGDIAAVLGALSDDIAWVLPSIPNVPFTGAKHGKDSVAEFFSTRIGPRCVPGFSRIQLGRQVRYNRVHHDHDRRLWHGQSS